MKLDYFIKDHGRTATLELLDLDGRSLQKLQGALDRSGPFQLKAGTRSSGTGYPSYELIAINGVTQVIEHRKMEPIFYVNQDPEVLKELTR